MENVFHRLASSMSTKQKGALGEQKARAYLEAQGLLHRASNYVSSLGEIDLIMQDQEVVVFVEVRQRARNDYGSAADSVTRQKQDKIRKTASIYLQKHKIMNKVPCRFDVITIKKQQAAEEILWYKNAF